MAEGSHHQLQQRIRQPISVPFLWEEKPGTPKRDWMPKAAPLIWVPSPARLIISVPFEWEEKPGKPLPCFGNPSPNQLLLPPPPWAISTNPFVGEEDQNGASGWTPLLPALQESPYLVSEMDSGSNSQNASTDTSVLEFLFPLYSPDAGFLTKGNGGGRMETEDSPKPQSEGSCGSVLARRTLTLEELILLSRKLSYTRKSINVVKPRFSILQEFISKNLFTCFSVKGGRQHQSPLEVGSSFPCILKAKKSAIRGSYFQIQKLFS